MKVICISGHAGHGKDTVAQIMRKTLWGYGKKVLIIHNADLLKFMCTQLFGWNGEKDQRGRTLLQHVGTDIVRSQCPDFWVDYIANVLKLFDGEWDYVLIPDCRFPNEIDNLLAWGYDVVRVHVVREGYDSGLTGDQKSHASETALDGVAPDYTIPNRGNMVDLTRAVLDFIIPFYENTEGEDKNKGDEGWV